MRRHRNLKSTTIYLHAEQIARLKVVSERTGVPWAQYIRRAVSLALPDLETALATTDPTLFVRDKGRPDA